MKNSVPLLVTGAASLLALKYFVFGLDAWNRTLHPGLVIAPNQRAFRKPLLGIFERREKCYPQPQN